MSQPYKYLVDQHGKEKNKSHKVPEAEVMFRYWRYVLKEKPTEFDKLLAVMCEEKIKEKEVRNTQVLGFRNWKNRIALNYYGEDFPWLLLSF